jgi:hypothetical protein
MRLLLITIFYCSFGYGQSAHIEINDSGLYINSKRIEQPVATETLLEVLGKPDRESFLANIIWTYDKLGLRIYIDTAHLSFKTLELDIKNENYSFSPKNVYSGSFNIYGTTISRTTTPAELLKVNGINFHHFLMNSYVGYTDSLILSFNFSENRRELENISVWFRDADDSMFVKTSPVTDSAIYQPVPMRYRIINYDTVVSHYSNVSLGQPGYKTWDSTKVRADIILEGYPVGISRQELTTIVIAIMNEKGIDVAHVFRSESASMLFRLSSLKAAQALKDSGGYLGQFKR